MIPVEEAIALILAKAFPVQGVSTPLTACTGRVLAEPIYADRDFPPFDRVTMDGIALRYEAFAGGIRSFRIQETQAAGQPPATLQSAGGCIEIMTGAMLPNGTDTVVRYEDLHLEEDTATVLLEAISFRQNIHFQGIDRKKGDLLVPPGRKIGSSEIGTAASAGKENLVVARLPRTALVSTGDEIIGIHQMPLPFQIRGSNAATIAAMLEAQFSLPARAVHFPDDPDVIRKGLETVFAEHDLIIISGAVSEGKFDHVPVVLRELGVVQAFHKVAQRPGKPFWFGHVGAEKVVFALPGNPVSAFLCARRYVWPFLEKSLGMAIQSPPAAVLTEQVRFKPALTFFLPVKLHISQAGQWEATPLPGHGSGDFANLNDADGFLALPPGQDVFEPGAVFPVYQYRF